MKNKELPTVYNHGDVLVFDDGGECVCCRIEESTHYIVKNGKPVFYKAIEKKKGDK